MTKRLTAGIASVLLCLLLMGAGIPERPVETPYICDYAQYLSPETKEELLVRCAELYGKTGVQLVVLTVPDLGGQEPRNFVREIMAQWEIGGKEEASVLLLVVQDSKTSLLAVGGGLQTVLTQEIIHELVQDVLQPSIAGGDAAAGIYEVTTQMLQKLENLDKPAAATENNSRMQNYFYIAFIVLTLFLFFRTRRVSRKARTKYGDAYIYKPYVQAANQQLYTDDGIDMNGFGGPGSYGDFDD